jgi:hypothetical protein
VIVSNGTSQADLDWKNGSRRCHSPSKLQIEPATSLHQMDHLPASVRQIDPEVVSLRAPSRSVESSVGGVAGGKGDARGVAEGGEGGGDGVGREGRWEIPSK